MTELKHFKQAYKDLLKAEQIAEDINRLALLLGAKPDGLNVTNSQRAVAKAVEEHVAARDQAKSLGYASLAFALMALGQKKPVPQLPDWATIFPNHWVMETGLEKTTGWKNGLRVENLYKAKAVTALQAQRKLDRIKPTLLQVLEELNWDPAQVDEVKDAFLTLSAEKFQEELFDFLRNKATGEEEEGGEATATQAETELEAKVEDLRIAAAETGEDFDEDAARCLLLSEA